MNSRPEPYPTVSRCGDCVFSTRSYLGSEVSQGSGCHENRFFHDGCLLPNKWVQWCRLPGAEGDYQWFVGGESASGVTASEPGPDTSPQR